MEEKKYACPDAGRDYCLSVEDATALVSEYGLGPRDVMMAFAAGQPLLSPVGQDLVALALQADLLTPVEAKA